MENETKICSSKNCIHNGEPQPLTNFSKCAKSKDGLKHICKDCAKVYYHKYQKEHDQEIKEKQKKYRQEHPEKRQEWYKNNPNYNKEYYMNHFEEIKLKKQEYTNKPAKYDTFFEKLSPYDECQKDPENPEFLQVKCKYCGNWFNPTNQQVLSRLYSLNSDVKPRTGECNLYCSDACKNACPIYGQKLYPKDFKQNTSREVQPELRKMVFARDNWTCQKCGKSKDDFPDLVLHCHHKYPLNEDPVGSADMDNCITFCADCHKWIHVNVPGCGYAEMKCSE